jgi:hypothetical protein
MLIIGAVIYAAIGVAVGIKWGSDLLSLDHRPRELRKDWRWKLVTGVGGVFWFLPVGLVYIPMAYEKAVHGY